MKLPTSLLLVILIGSGHAKAQASEIDDATYGTMLNTISVIRILSENCRLNFDSRYDADFLTALGERGVDVNKATQDLIDYHKSEKARLGDKCAADATARLKTLDTIYRAMLSALRG